MEKDNNHGFRLDWTKVRGIGNLQILARASFVFLILVPVLAGLWKTVRHGINRYNEIVLTATVEMKETNAELRQVTSDFTNHTHGKLPDHLIKKTNEASKALSVQAARLAENIESQAIESKNLPWPWAVGFFASVAILLAHLIYQARCPPEVQAQSYSDYSASRAAEYSASRSGFLFKQAYSYLGKCDDHPFQQLIEDYDERKSHGYADNAIERIELGIVIGSAQERYRKLSFSNPFFRCASAVLYMIAALLVLIILGNQSYLVAREAGLLIL